MSTPWTGKNLNQQGAAYCSVEFRSVPAPSRGAVSPELLHSSCCHEVALGGYLGLPWVIGISEYRGQMTGYPSVTTCVSPHTPTALRPYWVPKQFW